MSGIPSSGGVDLGAAWARAAALLAEHRDLLDARPWSGEVAGPVADRGWSGALLALDDAALDALEIGGAQALWPASLPASLRALTLRVREVCSVPPLAQDEIPTRAPRRRETPRKHRQVDALARAAEGLARSAARVVDVGSGHGHLTRELAERFGRPVVGIERSATLVDRARALSAARSGAPTFEQRDALEDGMGLERGDLAVALHACGELGDAVVTRAASVGARVALVGCCLQKQRAPARAPLASNGAAELVLPRTLLGLSNLTARDHGVEASRDVNLAARERRVVLHRLLAEGAPPGRLGAELEGLNRRAARADVASLVARAFALRGRPPPSPAQIAVAVQATRGDFARARRLSLPRALFARVLEVFVLLDRARFLADRGFDVRIGEVFPPEVSARNLALLAAPR